MRFSCTAYAIVSFLIVCLLNGLQSSKGCVFLVLRIQLSVFWSLVYRTVYNHPRDTCLLHWVCNCCLPVVSPLNGLQSSNGCVFPVLCMQLSISRLLAYQTVCNQPRDAFFLYLRMQLSVSWSLTYRTAYNHPRDACLPH